MNPVYHPHAAAFDEYRWQRLLDLCQPGDVPLVLPLGPRRITGQKGGYGDCLDSRITRYVMCR